MRRREEGGGKKSEEVRGGRRIDKQQYILSLIPGSWWTALNFSQILGNRELYSPLHPCFYSNWWVLQCTSLPPAFFSFCLVLCDINNI